MGQGTNNGTNGAPVPMALVKRDTAAVEKKSLDRLAFGIGSGDWADASYGASSWMSALLSDAVVRAYATGEDLATAQFLARFGAFLRATVRITADNDYGGTLASPRYAMLADGSAEMGLVTKLARSLDVATLSFGMLKLNQERALRTSASTSKLEAEVAA